MANDFATSIALGIQGGAKGFAAGIQAGRRNRITLMEVLSRKQLRDLDIAQRQKEGIARGADIYGIGGGIPEGVDLGGIPLTQQAGFAAQPGIERGRQLENEAKEQAAAERIDKWLGDRDEDIKYIGALKAFLNSTHPQFTVALSNLKDQYEISQSIQKKDPKKFKLLEDVAKDVANAYQKAWRSGATVKDVSWWPGQQPGLMAEPSPLTAEEEAATARFIERRRGVRGKYLGAIGEGEAVEEGEVVEEELIPTPAPAVTPTPIPTVAGKVKVINPEGQVGFIPRDQLKQALELNYRLAE